MPVGVPRALSSGDRLYLCWLASAWAAQAMRAAQPSNPSSGAGRSMPCHRRGPRPTRSAPACSSLPEKRDGTSWPSPPPTHFSPCPRHAPLACCPPGQPAAHHSPPPVDFSGPTAGRGRCARSVRPPCPAGRLGREAEDGRERRCWPQYSPRGRAGQAGLHCLSVQVRPAEQREWGRASWGQAPGLGGVQLRPPPGHSLTTGPGSPRSPGKPRNPGGPSFPGRPAGPGSP